MPDDFALVKFNKNTVKVISYRNFMNLVIYFISQFHEFTFFLLVSSFLVTIGSNAYMVYNLPY